MKEVYGGGDVHVNEEGFFCISLVLFFSAVISDEVDSAEGSRSSYSSTVICCFILRRMLVEEAAEKKRDVFIIHVHLSLVEGQSGAEWTEGGDAG